MYAVHTAYDKFKRSVVISTYYIITFGDDVIATEVDYAISRLAWRTSGQGKRISRAFPV